MKSITLVVLMAGVSACSKGEAPAPPARTVPVDPATPLNLEKPDQTRVRFDLASIRAEVKRRQQIDGQTPASLDALGLHLKYPDDLRYDPSSGIVKSLTYPFL